jgi:hypothetical protein
MVMPYAVLLTPAPVNIAHRLLVLSTLLMLLCSAVSRITVALIAALLKVAASH